MNPSWSEKVRFKTRLHLQNVKGVGHVRYAVGRVGAMYVCRTKEDYSLVDENEHMVLGGQ